MNLHEALALVLSPVGAGRPRLDRWHFHHDRGGGGEVTPGRLRIQLTLRESRAGSWDRPELAALSPVIGQGGLAPRALIVDLTAEPSASGEPVDAHWDIAAPGGPLLRDDLDALVALRRMNPLVWLRGAQLVSPRDQGARTPGANASVDTPPEVAAVLEHYEHLLGGTTTWQEGDIDAGFAAAERFLMQWAPVAHARRPGARAVVAEILSHELEPAATAGGALSSKMPLASSTVQKLGVLVLTARLVEHLRHGATPGVRPIIVIEEPEAGLHPMTLASVWSLLERFSTQKIVATHSGTLLSGARLHSVRRLTRGDDGVVREWRVPEGALGRDDLRRVSYRLRARRGAAFFARCWLLVEGETEGWILPDLARLCGVDLAQEGVACVEFAQCGLKPLVRLADALGIEWHVVVDGDRAGATYADMAGSLLRGDDPARRITRLAEHDIEHSFWEHGHSHVFERLAGVDASTRGLPPRRVIDKAIRRHSKPAVAFELLASAAAPDSAGAPEPLRRAIETCVRLARQASSRSAP